MSAQETQGAEGVERLAIGLEAGAGFLSCLAHPVKEYENIIGSIAKDCADAAAALRAQPAGDAEVARLQAIIERDRSDVARGTSAMREVFRRHAWLAEGRGSYEWDDDRWHDEFKVVREGIIGAMEKLDKIASDWTDCPKTQEEVIAARAIARQPAPTRELGEAHRNQVSVLMRLHNDERLTHDERLACLGAAAAIQARQPAPGESEPVGKWSDNALVSRIGEACSLASKDAAGDYIDRGLALIRHLHDGGFTLYASAPAPAMDGKRAVEGWVWGFTGPDFSEARFYREDMKLSGSDKPGSTLRATLIIHESESRGAPAPGGAEGMRELAEKLAELYRKLWDEDRPPTVAEMQILASVEAALRAHSSEAPGAAPNLLREPWSASTRGYRDLTRDEEDTLNRLRAGLLDRGENEAEVHAWIETTRLHWMRNPAPPADSSEARR